jgi:hypothetical protein
LRRFLETKRGAVTVELDGTRIEASTRIVTVSNAPLIGNHMLAAPGAKMDDGLLDVHVYDGISDAALVRHFIAASSGSPDDLECYRVRHVRITADEPMPTNADMNIAPKRHTIEIEVIPRAVAMIVGNGIALSVPVTSAPPAPPFAACARAVERCRRREACRTGAVRRVKQPRTLRLRDHGFSWARRGDRVRMTVDDPPRAVLRPEHGRHPQRHRRERVPTAHPCLEVLDLEDVRERLGCVLRHELEPGRVAVAVMSRCASHRRNGVRPTACRRSERIRNRHVVTLRVERDQGLGVACTESADRVVRSLNRL